MSRLIQFLIGSAIALIGGALLVSAIAGCVTTDQRKASAERNAAGWCEEMVIDCAGVQCSGTDSDGDGYVSCTVRTVDDKRIPLECGWDRAIAPLGQNTSCREQRAITLAPGQ